MFPLDQQLHIMTPLQRGVHSHKFVGFVLQGQTCCGGLLRICCRRATRCPVLVPRQAHACVTCMALNRPAKFVWSLQVYVVQITSGPATGPAPSLGEPAIKLHGVIINEMADGHRHPTQEGCRLLAW
jgi:hypothetical protein